MDRRALDKLISSTGLIVAVVLLAASGGLFYAHSFIHSQVSNQLVGQKITFPAADSVALAALPDKDRAAVAQYAGQPLTSGQQAEVFANHYIAAHLNKIGAGQTYAELSAASMASPSDTALAKKVDTVFRGETLRGMLLNAYAFDTMATVANLAALVALGGAILLLVLASLGFRHAKRATTPKRRR